MASYDAIIIGAGLSGLCSGALLARHGKEILLLDKRPYLGGRTGSIKYKGHILDDGPHMPDESGHLERVFATLGLEYPQLVDRLIELALARKAQRDHTERRRAL